MRLGLTGSLGSGKTTISNLLKDRGAIVIDADALAHEATKPGAEGFHTILEEFGTEYLQSDGTLDRKKLGSYVFSHPEALARLEKIVHPLVRKMELELLEEYRNEPLVVLSVPLLLENGLEIYVDKVLVVTISESERYARLTKNYGLSREEIENRLKNQMPQEEKIKMSDYIIDNSGSLEQSRKQVDLLLEKLVQKKGKKG
jgi:dephospho-CoA kinase